MYEQNFITGIVKSATASGKSLQEVSNWIKQALGEDMPPDQLQALMSGGAGGPPPGSMAGTPPQGPTPPGAPPAGAPPMPMPDGGAGGPPGAGGGGPGGLGPNLEGLEQLSDEEIDQLAQEIAAQMQGGGQGGGDLQEAGGMSPQEIQELSQAIEAHLGGGAGGPPPPGAGGPADAGAPPDAGADAGAPPMPPMPPEGAAPAGPSKAGSDLGYIKSAAYIEGFLTNALERGYNIKQAVSFYELGLNNTLAQQKQQVKQASDPEIDAKTAAYLQGLMEEAMSRGLNEKQAHEFLKQAFGPGMLGAELGEAAQAMHNIHPPHSTHSALSAAGHGAPGAAASHMASSPEMMGALGGQGGQAASAAGAGAEGIDPGLLAWLSSQIQQNPGTALGMAGGAGLGAGALGASMMGGNNNGR